MVFEFLKKQRDWIYSIQITGPASQMVPFRGLVLGDSKERVLSVMGKPDKIQKVGGVDAELYLYNSHNYSIEIDGSGVLTSIRIAGYKKLFDVPQDDQRYWENFVKVIAAKDLGTIASYFHPDAEIHKNNEVLMIDKSFDTFFKQHKGKFFDAIFSDSGSIYYELKITTPEEEIRLHEIMGPGRVLKFYTGETLQEIYFLPYANSWRIYEVKFKDQK